MNKQELIESYERISNFSAMIQTKSVIEKLKQLDEPEKVKIPQFVADWIEVAKTVYSLSGGMTYGGPGVNKWLENEDNQRTFTLAWFDGYEVEGEKRYRVKMNGIEEHNSYLKYNKNMKHWYFGSLFIYNNDVDTRTYHTRKKLEQAGFGWVFDCEGVEVEEVE